MSWNYRVVVKKYTGTDGDVEYSFGIHEVYYHEDGKIRLWTVEDVGIAGENLEELKQSYIRYGLAFEKPTLYWHEKEGNDELSEEAF